MIRGRVARVSLEAVRWEVATAGQELLDRVDRHEEAKAKLEQDGREIGRVIQARKALEAQHREFDEVRIALQVANVGEVTIRDLLIEFACKEPFYFSGSLESGVQSAWSVEISEKSRGVSFRFRRPEIVRTESSGGSTVEPESKLFPGQRTEIGKGLTLRAPVGFIQSGGAHHFLNWTAYLDDAPPCLGEILYPQGEKRESNP